jgi:hypothetical protein
MNNVFVAAILTELHISNALMRKIGDGIARVIGLHCCQAQMYASMPRSTLKSYAIPMHDLITIGDP